MNVKSRYFLLGVAVGVGVHYFYVNRMPVGAGMTGNG